MLTRPDITKVVSRLCRFMHAPTAAHLQDALFLLRYLKGTPEFGVTFVAQSGTLTVEQHQIDRVIVASDSARRELRSGKIHI